MKMAVFALFLRRFRAISPIALHLIGSRVGSQLLASLLRLLDAQRKMRNGEIEKQIA
jgi:hypothetical protein